MHITNMITIAHLLSESCHQKEIFSSDPILQILQIDKVGDCTEAQNIQCHILMAPGVGCQHPQWVVVGSFCLEVHHAMKQILIGAMAVI